MKKAKNTSKEIKNKRILKSSKKNLAILIIAFVVLFIFMALWMITKKDKNNQPTEEPEITYSTDTPDESKANADNYNWRGAPDEPKKILIPKINVDAYVQKSGIDQNNAVAVPSNVHLTGWFSQSKKPGQNGLSIISGHVSGRTTNGVFEKLKDLQKGDEFSVELGNGEVKEYLVQKKAQVKEKDAAGILFSQEPLIKSQLNLITCGGKFDKDKQQYEDRVIVIAKLKN